MAIAAITDIINWANISQYLGQFYLSRNNLFRGGDVDPTYPTLIGMEADILEFMYNFSPNDPNLDNVANYVYSITKYIAQAKVIAGQGGSGGIVIPGTSTSATITGMELEFELGTTPSPKTVNGVSVTLPNDGDTSLVIPIANIMQNSVEFVFGGVVILSEPINNANYVTISYNTSQITITLNGFTFSTGNNYIISGLQFVAT